MNEQSADKTNPYYRSRQSDGADAIPRISRGTLFLAACYLGAGCGSAGAFVFATVWGIGMLAQGLVEQDASSFLPMMSVAAATGGTLVGCVSGIVLASILVALQRGSPLSAGDTHRWFVGVLTTGPCLAMAIVMAFQPQAWLWIPVCLPCHLAPTLVLGSKWKRLFDQIESESESPS